MRLLRCAIGWYYFLRLSPSFFVADSFVACVSPFHIFLFSCCFFSQYSTCHTIIVPSCETKSTLVMSSRMTSKRSIFAIRTQNSAESEHLLRDAFKHFFFFLHAAEALAQGRARVARVEGEATTTVVVVVATAVATATLVAGAVQVLVAAVVAGA